MADVGVQIVHGIVHSPEQVREIIREAIDVADEATAPPDLWPDVFREACRLLGARTGAVVQPTIAPLDLSRLGINTGGNRG